MPFYRLYTPSILRSNAEFTSSYSYAATRLTFNADSTSYKRLFKLPLIPGAMLSRYADVTVVITVGLESSIRSSDSDPKFLLSDGERGIGFDIRDRVSAQCRGVQGLMGDTITGHSYFSGSSGRSSIMSEEFILTISPSQRWGSCYYGVDSGLISPISYSQNIYLDRGLWLEAYREGASEKYVINYIVVEIHEN